ncbi:LOW QUALITY PROTEIN: auxin transport protein BIG-like [Primulina tabacum]|uniref:LOW QUALITY PROTEIN: auxin transport protein BIG-like n=1 Tax=Primulina tabacum TaxID=48773 RepID=UPI003F59D42E
MAEEIAALVTAVSSGDFSRSLRSDASASVFRTGFRKLYSILKQSVKPVVFEETGSKVGLEVWDQARVHALACVSLTVVKALRSLPVEQVEPVVVAVVHQTIEFALCSLEKWIGKSDDLSLQNIVLQLLEVLLIDGVDKELDPSQSCSMNFLLELLPPVADKDDSADRLDHIGCMLLGGKCSKEQETDEHMLMEFFSECMQVENRNSPIIEHSLPQSTNMLIVLSQHLATVHFGCIHRLIFHCKELLELPVSFDEKPVCHSFRKILSFCVRILNLLASLAKDTKYVDSENLVVQSAAAFINLLPSLFRSGVDFAYNNIIVENSYESLAVHLLEEFLQVMQSYFLKNYVFQNIQVCIIASILSNLDSDIWRHNKIVANSKLPLAYYPRVIICILKLILEIKGSCSRFEFDDRKTGYTDGHAMVDSSSCLVSNEKFFLLKKHTFEELCGLLFPPSNQWLDNLIHLVIFLHSEGVKLKPLLERSCSSATKASGTSESDNVVCHEDEALFGDLFSEGSRSVGSMDGCEQSNVAVSSSSRISNTPLQAATELLSFLKSCVFSPEWHPPLFSDASKRLSRNHIDILLSILSCQDCCLEDRNGDNSLTLQEERKFGHVHVLCFELLQKLLLHRALSELLEESIVENILIIENGAYMYNDQTLALLARILVCRVGSAGIILRSKLYETFLEFIHEKAKTVSSTCATLKDIVETLPSLFHIEILLVAFHFSSQEEKSMLASKVLSALQIIYIPPTGFDTEQLSRWALLVSRLVLLLRHMIYHPRSCPSSLLQDFRTKLRESPDLCMHNSANYLLSWPATVLEGLTSEWAKQNPYRKILLNQMVDIAPVLASLCEDYHSVDFFGLSWREIQASFSRVLGFWKGKRAAKVDDLIIERYLFLLCWDIPVSVSAAENCQVVSSGLRFPDILNVENFVYFSHCIFGNYLSSSKCAGIPDCVLSLLQQLDGFLLREDVEELGWDFFRSGSWVSFALSFICTGIWAHNEKDSATNLGISCQAYAVKDAGYLVLAKSLISNYFQDDQITKLIKILSSLLNSYLRIYQNALSSSIKNAHLSLLKYVDFDNSMQEDFFGKMGINPSLLESFYELSMKHDRIVEKMSLGIRSKTFWKVVLHGFPLVLQFPGEIVSSCILNVHGIITILDGLMKVKDSRGISCEVEEVISVILLSILTIKCDKVFGSLKGECENICQSLSLDFEVGADYSSLFIMKRMEEFLQSGNEGKHMDSVHEFVVTKMIDIIYSLKDDPSKNVIFKFFLSVEDISEKIKNYFGSLRGDILVLIGSLDHCYSESVNVRVLNLFIDLLSDDLYPEVKQNLHKKFVIMDTVYLSKWLEIRLLGSVIETPNGVTGIGTSVSLRDSTTNFLMCLLASASQFQLQELQSHLHEAMLLSLDNAFMLFDLESAKGYFNFVVQISQGEALVKPLLLRTVGLIENLAGDERLLQGLKYLFGFLAKSLSDTGPSRCISGKLSGNTVSSSGSGLGPLSSRSFSSRKNVENLVLTVNQGPTSVDCDNASVDDDDEDDGTSDGEVGSEDKGDEDDNNSERALASKVCTFTSSGSNFMEQHWYFCYTCDLTVSKGCCSVCAKVCHRGHRVVYSRSSRFFCDCGAGGVRGSSCQCLKPRKVTGSSIETNRVASNLQSFLPLTDSTNQMPESDSDVDEDASDDLDNFTRLSISNEVQSRMPMLLNELEVEDRILGVCMSLLPTITGRREFHSLKDKKIYLAEDKVLHYNSDLLQLKKSYKSGSLDLKIKSDYSNAKELKSHLTSGSLVKSLLSVSSRGRLAVGEGDKVAIFDVDQLIGQATVAPITADKANVKPLSKNVVRFEIVRLLFNSLVENYLVVAGYEDCQVLTINHRGEVIDRLAIELALQGAYIRRVDWVPGSQVQLMVVTNRFVKIYDLSQDNISPVHYITLPDDTVVDATLIYGSHGRMFLIVLSGFGCLYRLEMSCEANVGARPLKEGIQIEGRNKQAKGSSLYFSSTHKLLFLSYQDGSTLIGRLNPDATSLIEMSAVYENDLESKLRPAGLHRWKELLGGSGLFVCYSSLKSNGVLAISLGEHEIFAHHLRHTAGSTSALVGVSAYKPLSKDKIHCLVLHEDGSLQIYSHIPAGVDTGVNFISDKVKKLGYGILKNKAYGGVKPEFPLDFFEKTVCITQDVKLSGDAIRNNDSEGAKQTLVSEDGFLEGTNPAGFKTTVTNSNPDIVMVGFRLHVGNTSASHIPSEITIFQRVIKLDEGMRSWYDIPFTVAESLLADEEFTISIGRTFSGSALPRIDSLEVYGRVKDEFGWKEKMDAILDMEAHTLDCNSWSPGSGRKSRYAQSALIQEKVVADGLKLLSRIYLSCKPHGFLKAEEVKLDLSNIKCKQVLESVYESDREPLLQVAASRVLQAVFPRREIYYQVKDAMRLSGVVKSTLLLSSKLGMGESTAGWIIEEFTAQMRAVSKIALHRRSNLAAFLENNGSEIVDGLMQVLWGILDVEQPDTQTMNNIVISSVELIYCYAECLVLSGKPAARQSVSRAVTLFKKLLLSTNEAVQTSSSLAISSRLLQVPFPKQTMLGTDELENTTPVPLPADATSAACGNNPVSVEEDSITSSVQYCCDGCSTVPILRRRWHCAVCPDFDLCEACYEVLDAERLPLPHSRDHPMSAIPIEVEMLSGDGNDLHYSADDLSDSIFLPAVADVNLKNAVPSGLDLEPNESGEFSASVVDAVTISESKRAVNSLLLSELLEQLKGFMKTASGVRAVPVMQLIYRLSSAIGGPFVDGTEVESINLEKLIKWFIDEIELDKPFIARSRSSFGEVTILVFMYFTLMLRNWNQPGGDVSGSKAAGTADTLDKTTIHNPPSTSSSSLDDRDRSDLISSLHRACGLLRQQVFINYLMDILQQLVIDFKSPSVSIETSFGLNPGPGCGAQLSIRREVPAGNFSPFFADSYAKAHRSDVFADYPRLLLENTFRLVYCLIRPEKHDKVGDKDRQYKVTSGKDLKLDGYQDVLCSYINNPHTMTIRRYARRLFLHLCGSKTQYYSVRDTWLFTSETKKLYKHITKSGGFQNTFSYERSVKIVKCLSTIAEVAAARPRNWQKYCLRHSDVLPFVMDGVFFFGEECVVQALKLLNLALYTGKDARHFSQRADGGDISSTSNKLGAQPLDSKKKKKGEEGSESLTEKSYMDMEQVVNFFTDHSDDCLKQFIDKFLLEWNSSSVRGEAKCVLLGAWYHGKQSFKESMLTALLQKLSCLPLYGQNVVEYTELVTSLLGKFPDNSSKKQNNEIVDKCLTADVIKCIFEALHSQNELLANHPNSRIYNTLSGLVEFDGYYLESEPCVACSSPEVPYSKVKLENLKSETKFTDNRIIVKCTGSYTIQSVTMNVHDARKSKSVKVLNLYYNNRPVADLSELKNNWSLWKRAKICHLSCNQTELKVEFPIPITSCNFMIELDSFYENLQALSLEPLQCPRCSRPVTDKHGICNNCRENAYQCRQCRNINYENLDSFLCNECGYSKYGRFEFNFMARPSFIFDSMENDEDMKRGLAAIESESESAHKRYQQLLGFKKPLLKIVSSIGENEMDSQQKDSVQQMMVSLPGPSFKINRKIALLGLLYGEKCKAAFDSVSKSVQTLQGLRQVLTSYLHQKRSDDAAAASRFVVSRSPNSCYGCASTFVTQCLELLLVLSKHPSSKKQLVACGILHELFENNIHQGPKTSRVQARAALCAFSEADANAVAELNCLLQKKVVYCLEHHRSIDIALATREELMLLSDICSLADEFWESRLRIVFQLLFKSIKLGAKHPAISEHVVLPCLKIISHACTPPKPDTMDKEPANGKSALPSQMKDGINSCVSESSVVVSGNKYTSESLDRNWDGSSKTQDIPLLSYFEWERGASYLDFVRRQYKVSQAVRAGQKSRPQRYDYLAMKYALRWKRRSCKTGQSEIRSFELGSWVKELILSACSQSVRSEMCMLISLLCGQSSSRRFRLLNLLMSLLPATLSAGENAAEYFELLFRMLDSEDARIFLTVRGCLATICKLITTEVNNVESLERSLHIDISQGFILHKLIELLGKYLEIPNIRSRFMRDQLLSDVLEALIVIRGLIVQKTKLIGDCNRLLKDLLDSLLLESNENKRQFIQACIGGLQIHGEDRKGRNSLFILEQLCNLICPSKPEPVYLLILNKAHTQEEFIRGSMTKNPYSSAEIGPLMRDVKNKICHQLDLLGLLEDDYGMELLVAGNIISLDLSIAQVYEQVWKKSNSQSSNTASGSVFLSANIATPTRDCPPMTLTYRLQGLDGEATEPMIKELDDDREESQDPEVEFAITGAVRECGGLEILLSMVQRLREDLKSNQEQLVSVLNLLMLCCKTKENRRALLRLGALGLLLETARCAFSVDAMEPAEGILLIVEGLTLEANESDNISVTTGVLTVSSEDSASSEQAKKIVSMFLERLSHPSGLKKSSKQQRNTEMVARILPYLTYGEPAAMEVLIQHFDPYLQDWSEFDWLQKQYEDNIKDEKIAQLAAKQKFALENFVRVSESLKTSSCGERFKDIILEKGITGVAVRHLKETFSCTGLPDFRTTAEWASGLNLPSVPLILSMLRGLSMGHLATQRCIDEEGILPLLHALESVPGENEIGARAENLLDSLTDKDGNDAGFLAEKIRQLRHATRDEMRRRALRKREQLLQGLGMRQESTSDGGDRIVVAQPILEEGLEDVEEEEDGLACMVCREGYRLRPTDLLGVYTYSKRVNLGVGSSGNARGDCVYTTVSHFNIIHFQCHQEAKRADAELKTPKKEWDGAALRNNETLCNNLFPLRGSSVPSGQYVRYVDQYWDYLNALGRADGNRLRLLTYDIVLMLARFATGASFSADSRGGGKESNSKFLPFMIQMARQLLDHDSLQRINMSKSVATYLSSPTSESKFSSPGTQSSNGTEETVQFMMVSSLLSESYESWLQHRRAFLQRGIYHAYMQKHGRSLTPNLPYISSPDNGAIQSLETSGSEELFSTIQPMLVYTGLIEQLQCYFKCAKSWNMDIHTRGASKDTEGENDAGKLEAWEVFMKKRLLNVKEIVGFSKELLSWLEDIISATDLQESFDVMGALSDVLSSGFPRCEDFVYAAISGGKS